MGFADRRAEGRDGVADPVLGQRDDIHVALDDDDLVEPAARPARLEEPVHLLALVEDVGLRRVQVLRLTLRILPEDPPAEADDAAAAIADREHDALPEPVVGAPGVALGEQPGVDQAFRAECVERGLQPVPARRRETDPEVAGDGAGETPLLEIPDRRRGRLVAAQPGLELPIGRVQHVVYARIDAPLSAALARNFHAQRLG